MNKLPVFRAFGNAVGFTLGNFFTIFRLSWLPFGVFLAFNLGLGLYLERVLSPEKRLFDPFSIFAHIDDFIFLQIVTMILQAITIAAVAVSIHRVILFGDRKPGSYFNFPFGGTELLYVLMGLITGLIVVSILAALLVPAVYLVAQGNVQGFFVRFKDWPRNVSPADFAGFAPIMFAYFVAWIICVYVCIRLAVWPPSIVATRSLSLSEPWSLTRGNVGRFIGLFLLIVPVIWLVAGTAGAVYWFANHDKFEHMAPPKAAIHKIDTAHTPVATPEDDAAVRDEMERAMHEQMERLQPYAPIFWFVELIMWILGTGFGVALISYSYKALKGYDARAPIPDAD